METTILIPARIRTSLDLTWLKAAIASARGQGKIIVGLNNCELTFTLEKSISVQLTGKNLASIRNQLVAMVQTKYFFFLDHDDILPKDAISALEEAATLLNVKDRYFYGDTVLFTDDSRLTVTAPLFNCEKLTRGVFFPNGVLQSVENAKKIGAWDENLNILEDKDWWLSAVEQGIIGEPVRNISTYEYRQHSSGMVGTTKGTITWKEAVQYIEKKHRKFYNGGFNTMACCGKNKNKNISKSLITTEGAVLLKYLLATGTTTFQGPVTKTNYKVSIRERFVNVDAKDASEMIGMRKQGARIFKLA